MRKNLILLLLIFTAQSMSAKSPELRFNDDGRFKIVQFTDLHIRLNDSRSDTAFERMSQVLIDEQPDLVIITGDIIYNAPADTNMRIILDFFEKRKQPFAITFGNHDRDYGLSNAELFDIAKSFKYNYTRSEVGISGVGNCTIEIKSAKKDTLSAVLYLFDSGKRSEIEGDKGYAHVKFDQIAWYRTQSTKYRQQAGKPLPSLVFLHIPLPEYAYLLSDGNASMYGIRREPPCSPALNSGLFTSFKEMGDVFGVFAGHDHDNDYAANYNGILLAYGRFTGGPTEYIHIPNGARIIELQQGKRIVKSWIRTANGIEQLTTFPEDYIK